MTLQLADVFAGDIDFYHDLRRGDRFTVVYEVRYVDGEPVGVGAIVAAEFENRGRALRAFLWRGEDGARELLRARTALRCARHSCARRWSSPASTSGFSNARFHPILQTWRAHKGVDYAAPAGTPVRATGNAKVAFAGTQDGYGNVIQLQHSGAFSTLYAHLSRFAPQVTTGARVRAGRRDRLRRADRLGDGAAPPLRVPRGRRAAQSADGRAAVGRAARARSIGRSSPSARRRPPRSSCWRGRSRARSSLRTI